MGVLGKKKADKLRPVTVRNVTILTCPTIIMRRKSRRSQKNSFRHSLPLVPFLTPLVHLSVACVWLQRSGKISAESFFQLFASTFSHKVVVLLLRSVELKKIVFFFSFCCFFFYFSPLNVYILLNEFFNDL